MEFHFCSSSMHRLGGSLKIFATVLLARIRSLSGLFLILGGILFAQLENWKNDIK